MMKKTVQTKINPVQNNISTSLPRNEYGTQIKKNPVSISPGSSFKESELNSLKEVASTVRQIKLSAQRELEMARMMRKDAQKYQQEAATRARSEAQQLILRTRLATQRETEELIRQASEEIQKVLADIRMIRITAQEELATQRKFTNAAELRNLSKSLENNNNKDTKNKNNYASII